MPFLVILKRFEVWLLLLLVAGLIAFALQTPAEVLPAPVNPDSLNAPAKGTSTASPVQGETSPPVEPLPSLAIREVRVSPSSGGYIVETLLSGRAPGEKDLPLDESTVRASTTDGVPVRLFFEPFRERQVLLASAESTASLRWWLPASGPSALWIEIDNVRLQAKLP